MVIKDNKNYWIIGFIILGLVIGWFAFFYTPKQQYFNKIELSNTNFVLNRTDITYLDTIIKTGLDELGYTNIIVQTRPISIDGNIPNIELKAHIVASITNNNLYLIEINNDSRSNIIKSISHELIHLNQMHSGKLKISKDYVIWNGDTIRTLPEYDNRVWEQDAFGMGRILEEKIRKKLYSK